MRRPFPIAVALACLISFHAQAEILIGAAGPMTGKLTWIGEQLQRGAELAVHDVNAQGGVLGQPVRLIIADDFCDTEQAIAAAKKLVADKVVFVVGHYCSGASIPAAGVYEAAGVLQISPGSTNPLLTDQGRANVFRVIPRDDAQGTAAGNLLADQWGRRKIAILHDGTTYGRGLAEQTKKRLNSRNVTEASYLLYEPGKSDYAAEIARLEEAGIDVIYVGGYHTEVALMASAARDRDYSVQFVSGDAMATEELALIAGPAAEGLLFTFTPDARRNPEAAAVVARYRAENYEPYAYTLLTYGAIQVWAQAVAKAGSLDVGGVIDALHKGEFSTVLGPIAFDDKGDLMRQTWAWYVWKNGEYVPVD
ncbi:branched-chain amino acid ABC transporter substrate-binding protein [Rhizobium sp. ARZ01]|uniref:branched-chain amino acid ABC transporter substrate-binding protein n=1 Tax=Rhizobium sp. ARZ01 TaxID=2769313 RepID=UPI0017846F55|nr:branched-chain amino acid ABC transporter substrate-binding protein [Rhizobium sp. ARZ01]MBD9375212.1 branched-chain amino acid ABC transporter substrate-binding protein [Rhizobium sp. ARZ01]